MSNMVSKRTWKLVGGLLLAWAAGASAQPGSEPVLDVWGGTSLAFGQLGTPQNYVNVLGNVSDPDGILSLSYRLNGGEPVALWLGPDDRRLVDPGDFNADIALGDLIDGANTVVITAVDSLSNVDSVTVAVDFTAGTDWPLPWGVDWSTVASVEEAAQIVDGQWYLDGVGARTTHVGYDRLLVVGDVTWSEYEILLPITIHAVGAPGPVSGFPGVGILTRWTGHTDNPVAGWQPKSGWLPSGAYPHYDFGLGRLYVDTLYDPLVDMGPGDTFWWRVRVEQTPGLGGLYSVKVWEDGLPEPPDWNIQRQRSAGDVTNGSPLLIAHHVDVTFGNMLITPLTLAISDVVATVTGPDTVLVTWTSDNPATSRVDYGLDTSYGDSVVVEELVTAHAVELTGLAPDAIYHFRVTSEDVSGNVSVSGDYTFNTATTTLASDDFNSCVLDSLWTFADPLGDCELRLTGTQAAISVPAFPVHDVWGTSPTNYINTVPRLTQAVNDTDFELEVKFDSGVATTIAQQGILIQEDDDDLLRVEFHHNGGTKIFTASIAGGIATTRQNQVVYASGAAPLWLRVRRQGDLWTTAHSDDGVDWTEYSFYHSLAVSAVSVYAGNHDVAHTALVDYVFNTADPISPEDPDTIILTALVEGGGNVVKDPDLASYACGDTVVLTAVPNPGWLFHHWSGDLAGSANPDTLVMDGARLVSAHFVLDPTVPGTVIVDAAPDSLDAPWQLHGPAGVDSTGTGDAVLTDMPLGQYVLTWGDVAGWLPPAPNPDTLSVADGDTITFAGTYRSVLPRLVSIADVPNDQGRNVRLVWERSPADSLTSPLQVTGYGVYRRQDDYKTTDRRVTVDEVPAVDADPGKLDGWDFLVTVPANGDSIYQYVAQTLCDSTSEGLCWSVFFLRVLTDDPFAYYDAPADSGYSVDNLVPGVPESFLVAFSADGNALSWDAPPDPDVQYYVVYRDGGADCDFATATAVASVAGTSWTDDLAGIGGTSPWNLCYWVAAVDFAGNEGEPTAWDGATVTDAGDAGPPARFALGENYPNPFNPVTTIRFELPQARHVRLWVLALDGRRVATLVDGTREAGRHEVQWRGTDDAGRRVASGAYLYRIEAGDYVAVRRMLLLK